MTYQSARASIRISLYLDQGEITVRKLLLLGLLCVSAQANANQFWTPDFTISSLHVSSGENYHYRVYGMPATTACLGASSMAFLNESFSGAKGQIAALLMAYTAGKSIRLFVEPDANSYCKILEVVISN